jgi:hypothetical protein
MIAQCHPTRLSQARGLCKSCYDKWLKSVNPVYKKAQFSNTTNWKRNNPEKWKLIEERRKLKRLNDPNRYIKQRETILKKYNLSLNDYKLLLDNQLGGCAICLRKPGIRPLHVDHNHQTGKVRGLLCHQCNWYLGTLETDLDTFERLQQYLQTHRILNRVDKSDQK